ncbi:glutathione gamma-glutamylcysteinyltransferase 1 isoform X2 [Aristolochia californica]|uniref:glutathione gamma-glutamylcysteinyltransferase 1 isoform X2 n=1 Tax=Aristolochia californica TaxID=171875 RepID=UPI0035DE0A15
MALAGLYRRVLPSPPAIEFSSSDGKQLFSEALQSGTMEGFFKLISYFQTQSEPAYCGLASLSMVLNALAIDPGRKWKGPWRWFDESMLDCCEPLEKVKKEGITFGKVACLGHCAGAKVETFRTNQSTIDDFRKHVVTCTASEDYHLITSYHRAPFKQTGSGHFSPIGGYHAGRDMALILDVARFKYPPHWVPLTLLWEAMDTTDEATGHQRGFMLISRRHIPPSLLYTLSCNHESWVGTAKYLIEDVPVLLKSEDIDDVQKVLSVVFTSLPTSAEDFIKWVAEVRRQEEGAQSLSKEEKARLDAKGEILQLVHETQLFKCVTEWLSLASFCCRNASSFCKKENLSDIGANVCCQGAEIFAQRVGASGKYCCRETCVQCLKVNGGQLKTLVSGTVMTDGSEQGFDMLVPVSQTKPECCNDIVGTHPTSNDVLTVLLLALPPSTWSGISDKKLLEEIQTLLSVEKLPVMLQDEELVWFQS